jgi:hypothetical protein
MERLVALSSLGLGIIDVLFLQEDLSLCLEDDEVWVR